MVAAWWLYFIALLGLLVFLLHKFTSRKYDYWKKRNVEFVKPVPFFGSIIPIFAMKTTIGEWLWELYKSVNADYFGIFTFDRPVLVVRDSKLVKKILLKDFAHFEDRSVVTDASDPVMDNLMFFKNNPAWKPVRNKLSPAFSSGKLKAMFPLIMKENEAMLGYLSTKANIPNMEAKEITAKLSTNVIARCAFAVDAGSFKNEDAEFRNITREMFGFRVVTGLRQLGSWFTPNIIKVFRIQFFHSEVVKACKRIFGEILQMRKASNQSGGTDLIDILLETNRKYGDNFFTDDAMVGHAIQFFAAGFETVSSTLSFTLYELAIHPAMQERLRDEIREYIERDGGITYGAIHDMKYLDMVVSETLRKYPVLPFLDRICKADYKVEGTDLVIEKGIPVYIPMFGLHYDPKYFPDPQKYDPERFEDKTKINADGMYYVPFGEGPRICIGERFGLLGVKSGLASILSKFRVEKSDKTPIPIEFDPKSFVLQSKVGIPLTFVPL